MGSGHVLVYAFDVFMQLYTAEGFRERDAAELIMTNNLFGLEIDKRAYQLAYFAIIMKGREYNRRILSKEIKLNLHQFIDSPEIPNEYFERLSEVSPYSHELTTTLLNQLTRLLDQFKNATEIGSILKIEELQQSELDQLNQFIGTFENFSDMDILYQLPEIQTKVISILDITRVLMTKYTAVTTNPPYLNKMSSNLDKYVKKNYPDVKTDLFSVFIKMNSNILIDSGYAGFMTPFVWMFIKSYEELRSFLITNKSISSLIQMEYSAFEEATVPVCCFVIKNAKTEPVGNYLKLSDFKGGMTVQKEKVLEAILDNNVGYFYQTNQNNLIKIPGQPISYWINENIVHDFVLGKQLGEVSEVKKGMFTGQNDLFFRTWTEPAFDKIQFNIQNRLDVKMNHYVPINKGGGFRRWYGNNEFIMKFDDVNYNIIEKNKGHRSPNYYFKPCIEWTKISSGKLALRYSEGGFVNNDASMFIYSEDHTLLMLILGIASTKVSQLCVSALNESMNYTAGDIARIPILVAKQKDILSNRVVNCVEVSKDDWDSFENSWNFKKHPLV